MSTLRPITVTLYPNDGSGTLNASLSVESYIPDDGLGRIAWDIDGELTKVSPADLTLRIADDDGTVWAWILSELETLQSSKTQLYQPWIVLTCAGETIFTGCVDLVSLKRDVASRMIDLSAQDWSTMLENIDLSDMKRHVARVLGTRAIADLGMGHFSMGAKSVIYLDLTADVVVGDYLTSSVSGAQNFKVTAIRTGGFYYTDHQRVYLDGWDWSNYGSMLSATFEREASNVDSLPAYTLQSAVKEGSTFLNLDSLDGLAVGDSMTTADGTEILIGDLDPECKTVISARSLAAMSAGTAVYLSSESQDYLVHEDALALAQAVVLPYSLDTTRFTPTALPSALFSWMTSANATGRDLFHPSDIEPTLTALRVICEDQGYVGEAETGWSASGGWGERYVDWTAQSTTAPSSLMPDEGPYYAPSNGQRNRVFYSWTNNHEQYTTATLVSGRYYWSLLDATVYASRSYNYPAKCIGYDYSQLRRVIVTNATGQATYSEQRWDGSAWTTATTGNWPVAAHYPCQIVPMVGTTATVGPVSPQGLALLTLVTDGTQYFLELVWESATVVSLQITTAAAAGAVLLTTPWGVFLVGPGGYGRITYASGALNLAWIAVSDPNRACLIPSTFCAVDSGKVYCFMRLDYADPDDQAAVLTETRILELTTTPVSGVDPVLFSQRVMAGAPRIARAVRDPGDQTRIVGILGARLFRISDEPAQTIERMSIVNMTGIEALEHIAQFLNAIVVPRASGTVELVSRAQTATATALTVDQVDITETLVSEHFFSVVRVSSSNDEDYADAEGSVLGGKPLEISNSPAVWTESGCYAMASTLAKFFGVPRLLQEENWCYEDPASAPPWEALDPWAVIAINGGSTTWFFAGLDYDLVKGEAKATLLEVV